jgi:hypothetical protein
VSRRPRARPRGTIALAVAIVAVFVAVLVNVPQQVRESHWRKRDRPAIPAYLATHEGRRAYGKPTTETHARYDLACVPHFPAGRRTAGADYKLYLVLDSHTSGRPARVIAAVRGPLDPKPTDTGPKCGAVPRVP